MKVNNSEMNRDLGDKRGLLSVTWGLSAEGSGGW